MFPLHSRARVRATNTGAIFLALASLGGTGCAPREDAAKTALASLRRHYGGLHSCVLEYKITSAMAVQARGKKAESHSANVPAFKVYFVAPDSLQTAYAGSASAKQSLRRSAGVAYKAILDPAFCPMVMASELFTGFALSKSFSDVRAETGESIQGRAVTEVSMTKAVAPGAGDKNSPPSQLRLSLWIDGKGVLRRYACELAVVVQQQPMAYTFTADLTKEQDDAVLPKGFFAAQRARTK